MTWLGAFESDVLALERARGAWVDVEFGSAMTEVESIFAPILDDRSIDPGDLEAVTERWWRRFRSREIALAQEECAFQRRLVALYARLEHASEDEWEAYAHMVLKARVAGQRALFQRLLNR